MNGGAVDWKNSKQSTTTMSSMEAGYTVVVEAAMEALWISFNRSALNHIAVDWKNSKQSTTTMSSMEAGYTVVVEAAMEALWICKFIYGLEFVPSVDKPMDMYGDNIGAITIAGEPGFQKGAKNFQRKYHFIREAIQEGDMRILKVHTYNNLADPFTKPMPCTKHVDHAKSIGLTPAGSFM
nr:hypothetical protein [Tanacetum cinerariifolium]